MIFLTQEDELPSKNDLVVCFFLPKMPFYSKLLTVISKIEKQHPDIKVYAVDAAYFTGLCKRFAVENVPQFLAYKRGQEILRLSQTVRTKDFSHFWADICTFSNLSTEKT